MNGQRRRWGSAQTKTWNMGLVLQVGRMMMRTETGWRGCWEARAQGLARSEEKGWHPGPGPALLTLPVAQGLGPQREARGRQRRLQQEQARPRHQQREQRGEEGGGWHLGPQGPAPVPGLRDRHGRQGSHSPRRLRQVLGSFRLLAAVSHGNSGGGGRKPRLPDAPPRAELPNPVALASLPRA